MNRKRGALHEEMEEGREGQQLLKKKKISRKSINRQTVRLAWKLYRIQMIRIDILILSHED